MPNCLRKDRLKWAESLKPQKKAISVIVLLRRRGLAKSFLHCSRRRARMQSPSVLPVLEKRRCK